MHIATEAGLIPDIKALLNLRYAADQLLLKSKRRVSYQRAGDHLSNFKGRGIDFDEVRLYQPGDDVRSIDWKVTARTGKPHTKLFREERERPIFILVDYSASMQFGTKTTFKSVIAAQAAAIISWAAMSYKDRVGGFIFSEHMDKEIRPMGGRRGILHFINGLANAEFLSPQASNDNLLAEYLKKLRRVAKPGSLIYVISDFDHDNSDEIIKQYSRLSLHHDVLNIHVYDLLEKELPKGVYQFADHENHKIALDTRNKKTHESYQTRYNSRLELLEKLYRSYRISYVNIATSEEVGSRLQRTFQKVVS
tara:strand:- start:309 stop:1232 length:924 start_codon:yes stop_codon:yes gene_type:complete